jgi:hypothetical protein
MDSLPLKAGHSFSFPMDRPEKSNKKRRVAQRMIRSPLSSIPGPFPDRRASTLLWGEDSQGLPQNS